MSASASSRVGPQLRQLAESHEAGRRTGRWLLRGLGWGFPISLILIHSYGGSFKDVVGGQGCLTQLLIWAGIVEAAIGFTYWRAARAAASSFNRALPRGTAREDAVALLRERCREGWERGRAARRYLRALYLPLEEPQEEVEPSPAEVPTPARVPALDLSAPKRRRLAYRPRPPAATIPIEVTPRTETPPTSRESAPLPLPLQPEAARGGENE